MISTTHTPSVAQAKPDGSDNSPRFMNERQLAERWGVSVKTIQALRLKGGGVRYAKLGRCVRYRLDHVEAYETARTRANTSEVVSDA